MYCVLCVSYSYVCVFFCSDVFISEPGRYFNDLRRVYERSSRVSMSSDEALRSAKLKGQRGLPYDWLLTM